MLKRLHGARDRPPQEVSSSAAPWQICKKNPKKKWAPLPSPAAVPAPLTWRVRPSAGLRPRPLLRKAQRSEQIQNKRVRGWGEASRPGRCASSSPKDFRCLRGAPQLLFTGEAFLWLVWLLCCVPPHLADEGEEADGLMSHLLSKRNPRPPKHAENTWGRSVTSQRSLLSLSLSLSLSILFRVAAVGSECFRPSDSLEHIHSFDSFTYSHSHEFADGAFGTEQTLNLPCPFAWAFAAWVLHNGLAMLLTEETESMTVSDRD